MEQPEWSCKIEEGSAGLVNCFWSPDSKHVMTTCDFQLRITLWSLVNKSVAYIKHPKLAVGGVDFSRDGKFMAVAERKECKDFVSVFLCSQWEMVSHFSVDTKDLAGVSWSPNGGMLCLQDSLLYYNVLLYSMDGRCVATYSAYENALGVKSLAWSPTGQFLAVGSYDQRVRLLNHITWKTVAELKHPSDVLSTGVLAYKEDRSTALKSDISSGVSSHQTKYKTITEPSVAIPSNKPDPEKPHPKLGVGAIKFSCDSQYLATLNDNMPTAVWIWNVKTFKLNSVLLHCSPVQELCWDPASARLAVCTGNDKLYVWSPAGCLIVSMCTSTPFSILKMHWHPSGSALLLIGAQHFCVCYLQDE